MNPMDEKTIARFESKVDKSAGPDGCWPWKGAPDKNGYGAFRLADKKERAPRVAFLMARGRWPEPFCCHRCDCPPCVNPAHLFEGTVADNNKDRLSKGRYATGDAHHSRLNPERLARGERNGARLHPETRVRGERHNLAVLTDVTALSIPALKREGLANGEIATLLGVSRNTVRSVLTGRTWRHLFPDGVHAASP